MPVENFPPAINIARYFVEQGVWDVSVCTNRDQFGRQEFSHSGMEIIRGTFPKGKPGIARILAYCSFHVMSIVHLMKRKPNVVLYIEPHSAFPAFFHRLIFRNSRIFIHYHEYHSPEEFRKPGMRMAKWSHFLETNWLYRRADWISQTNESRLNLFSEKLGEFGRSKGRILPNYPPRAWEKGGNHAWQSTQNASGLTRFVYVGALSRANTFIEEVIDWIRQQGPDTASLDIFSYNMHEETRLFLKDVADEQIRLHEEGIPYDELPQLLREFHVGLILYKGNTLNYAHNATNKLFEYLACGLDVIYPEQMQGVKPYATNKNRPRVIECDFSRLHEFRYEKAGRQQLPASEARFSCESELEKLETAMLNSLNV